MQQFGFYQIKYICYAKIQKLGKMEDVKKRGVIYIR